MQVGRDVVSDGILAQVGTALRENAVLEPRHFQIVVSKLPPVIAASNWLIEPGVQGDPIVVGFKHHGSLHTDRSVGIACR